MLRHLGFDERADATRRFLSSAVALEASARAIGRDLSVSVTVRNLTGHKLPTGLPGRRLWLHLTALDSKGRIVFESGAWNSQTGDLRHGDDFELHRDAIQRSNQTAIYEAVIEDARGALTNLLTQAVRFRKDNRLLPAGFHRGARLPEGVMADWIAPVGLNRDEDFQSGQDTVHYRVRLPKVAGPIRVSVEACFQSIPPADASLMSGLPRGPEIIASAEALARVR
jgi:hypothetical protein